MSSPVNIGDVLAGKYQIERVLGVGGMGVVVAAKHLHLGERVAIKFLLPAALTREDVVLRFRQEARAAAKLKSDHVAKVHDVGTLDSGAPYMVMEYLDGCDVGVVLRDEGPLAIDVAVDYVLQACEALAEAHAAGIIHRDLKPGNLFLIRKNDGTPAIKIIDFGISKVGANGEPSPDGTGEMTQTAVMMGSPLYMAPEQMVSARDVDARADIWSLGVLLHCLLTGGPPFKAGSVMQVYELISQGTPPLRSLRPAAPEGLEQVLLRCLQKHRDHRYDTVADLAAALVPFGPAHAQSSAERTARILQVKPKKDSVPPAERSSTPAVKLAIAQTPGPAILDVDGVDGVDDKREGPAKDARASGPASLTGAPARLSASASQISLSASSPGDPSATDGPWGHNTHPPARRRKTVSLMIAGALGTVVIGAGVLFALRARDHHESTPSPLPPTSAQALAPSTPSTPPSAPAVMPGGTAPEIATAAPIASASASIASIASIASMASTAPPLGGSARAKAVAVPPGKTATPAKTAAPKDLWGDPR